MSTSHLHLAQLGYDRIDALDGNGNFPFDGDGNFAYDGDGGVAFDGNGNVAFDGNGNTAFAANGSVNSNGNVTFHASADDRRSLLAVDGEGMLPRLELLYRGVRPILAIVAELPLIAPSWRDALRLFLATLDAIVAAGVGVGSPAPAPSPVTPAHGTGTGTASPVKANPTTDFKAGKDL